jgi:hypothetical protein
MPRREETLIDREFSTCGAPLLEPMKNLLISAIAGSAILSTAAVSFYIHDKSPPATGNVQTGQARETTTSSLRI